MRPGRYIQYKHYVRSIKHLLWTSVVFFLMNSCTFLLMPTAVKATDSGKTKQSLLIIGIVFWVSIAIGYSLLLLANCHRREFVRKKLNGDLSMGCRMGLITFFSTIPGIISDAAFIAALIAFLIVIHRGTFNNYISYVLLAVLSFSLNMHGIFNGRIYKTTKIKRITRRGEEK